MKRTRRIASLQDRYAVLERDQSDRCVLCGGPGKDFDHAVRLSSYLPHINESWNLNILCLWCHDAVTNPDTKEKWEKALRVIQLALHRAYDLFPMEIYRKYYAYYTSKRKRFEHLYGKQKNKL